MNKKNIQEIEKKYGLKPNKRLGQNFLLSADIIGRIIDALSLNPGSSVLEIGPGLGALTEMLASRAGSVTAVEIDSGFAAYLAEKFAGRETMKILHGDFLKMGPVGRFDVIVSNLPYYCASEIIFKLAVDYPGTEIFVMVQKELAERFTAGPGMKNYSALTVNSWLYFDVSLLFRVNNSAFYPRPDVSSSFIRLIPKKVLMNAREGENFHSIVKSAFWGRRKTITRALTDSPHLSLTRVSVEKILVKADIDGSVRGEDLGFEEYVRIAMIAYDLAESAQITEKNRYRKS